MGKALEALTDNIFVSIGLLVFLCYAGVALVSCAENYGKQHVVTVTNVVNHAEEPKDK